MNKLLIKDLRHLMTGLVNHSETPNENSHIINEYARLLDVLYNLSFSGSTINALHGLIPHFTHAVLQPVAEAALCKALLHLNPFGQKCSVDQKIAYSHLKVIISNQFGTPFEKTLSEQSGDALLKQLLSSGYTHEKEAIVTFKLN